MGKKSKTFVCVVFHHSKLRPQGLQMAENFCKSWKDTKLPFHLIVLDNESDVEYECINDIDHTFIRINNQLEIGGCTGAWNILCQYAIDSGADKIMGFADDVIVNNSLLKFNEFIVDDNTLYGPLTDGQVNHLFYQQKSNKCIPNLHKKTDLLNGFWLGFTRNFWLDKNINGDLFIQMKNPLIDKWAGQELMLSVWRNKYDTRGMIIGDCWIHHSKIRSWKNARQFYKNK